MFFEHVKVHVKFTMYFIIRTQIYKRLLMLINRVEMSEMCFMCFQLAKVHVKFTMNFRQ